MLLVVLASQPISLVSGALTYQPPFFDKCAQCSVANYRRRKLSLVIEVEKHPRCKLLLRVVLAYGKAPSFGGQQNCVLLTLTLLPPISSASIPTLLRIRYIVNA